MIQLIVGQKGKGKTKRLLDKVNEEIKTVSGNIVYVDKSSKHMYELNNKIRLIDMSKYPVHSSDSFIGFICGVLSQDHDLDQMYLDSFLKIAGIEENNVEDTINKLEKISEQYNVLFVISMSVEESDLSESAKSKVI